MAKLLFVSVLINAVLLFAFMSTGLQEDPVVQMMVKPKIKNLESIGSASLTSKGSRTDDKTALLESWPKADNPYWTLTSPDLLLKQLTIKYKWEDQTRDYLLKKYQQNLSEIPPEFNKLIFPLGNTHNYLSSNDQIKLSKYFDIESLKVENHLNLNSSVYGLTGIQGVMSETGEFEFNVRSHLEKL